MKPWVITLIFASANGTIRPSKTAYRGVFMASERLKKSPSG
jgi:hypothetical protein